MSVRRLIPVQDQDPLKKVRELLKLLWENAPLDGLFIPIWQDDAAPVSTLITSPDAIKEADPFAPVMLRNSALTAAKILQQDPDRRLGFVLRPCELSNFLTLLQRWHLDPQNTITISMDCLATFPVQDFDWRLERSDHREYMSRSALHFAAQGGILPSRYRSSCQFCDEPFPKEADLHFELLGITTLDNLVVNFRTDETASYLGMNESNSQPLPDEISARRERILKKLMDWRQKAQAYALAHLSDENKSIEGLLSHLKECVYCHHLIQQHCPLFDMAWIMSDTPQYPPDVEIWLQNCGGCGMCESDCPQEYPLFKTILYLHKSLSRHSF
jgi:Pyruvate/2-oxoacid:ferredoxin oxidoreductase delta subunit